VDAQFQIRADRTGFLPNKWAKIFTKLANAPQQQLHQSKPETSPKHIKHPQ
jgi:hypothetical protein